MNNTTQLPTVRCSGIDRLIRCPGSRVLEPLVRRRRDLCDANNGSYIHYQIARTAIEEMDAVYNGDGELPEPYIQGLFEPPADADWVTRYCIEQLGIVPADSALEVEGAFAYEFDGFVLSGHIDAFSITADGADAWGFDWKTGRNPVESAESNWQVLGYIALLKRAYPSLRSVTFRIVQPWNCEADGNERVSETVLEGADLDAASETLARSVRGALASANELESGLTQCRWCPVGIQCPAIQKEIKTMMAILTPEALAKIKAEADDALLGDMVVSARTVEPAIKQAEDMLHARLDDTGCVVTGGGVTITRKIERGAYTVTNPVAVYNELHSMMSADHIAPLLGYPVTKIKGGIAESMGIPKSGRRASMTAETVFAAKLAPYFEQGTRKKLIFS